MERACYFSNFHVNKTKKITALDCDIIPPFQGLCYKIALFFQLLYDMQYQKSDIRRSISKLSSKNLLAIHIYSDIMCINFKGAMK